MSRSKSILIYRDAYIIARKDKDRELSERKCIVTGAVSNPDAMIRFVRSPAEGEVIADLRHELPGRGVWVGNNQELLAQAVKRKLFARGFRESCKIPADLDERVGKRLDELALGYLSLARKAGQAVHGFEKVDGMISAGRIEVLIAAGDGAADGRGKLMQRLRASGIKAPVVDFFLSAQLGLALGRTNVIHAAMTNGGLAGKFAIAAHRAQEYRVSADRDAPEYEEKA